MRDAVFFDDAQAFRDWLVTHAHLEHELLVGFHKVGSGRPCMRWSDSVDQALCYGWIDGVRRRIDDATYTIRFTPRKPGSIWSAINIDKVARLRALGLMTPLGEAAFALRSEDRSRVYAYERTAPADLADLAGAELERFRHQAAAWAYFDACPPGYRQRMLHHIQGAKRAQTRSARLTRLIDACAAGRRLDDD